MQICDLCHTPIAGPPRKHLKSRAHKLAVASPSVIPRPPPPPSLPRRTAPCIHCLATHTDATSTCAPPPFVRRPKPHTPGPFVTAAPPAFAPLPDGARLEDVLVWGCRAGAWRRPPNLEVDGVPLSEESGDGFAAVATALERVAERVAGRVAQGGGDKAGAWVSFDADSELVHPAWFPSEQASLVPTYANVIVTLGDREMSIGLHVDTDNGPNARKPPVKICTYLHVHTGSKRVVLVPLGCKNLDMYRKLWLGGTAADGPDEAQPLESGEALDIEDEAAAPVVATARKQLVLDGGFYFALREHQLLLMPHGWYHWLIADPGLTITMTGSRY